MDIVKEITKRIRRAKMAIECRRSFGEEWLGVQALCVEGVYISSADLPLAKPDLQKIDILKCDIQGSWLYLL